MGMKYTFCFMLLFIWGSCCIAQSNSLNNGGTDRSGYYLEIPYQSANGYLFVAIEINGVKRKFLFDTGAPMQISPELFTELKPEVFNRLEITDAAGNKDHLNLVRVKEIKLNDLSFIDIPALVSSSELYTCMNIDGVIGSNLFRNSIVQIEPSKNLIILTDQEAKLPLDRKMATKLIAGEPQSYPYFMLELNAKKKQMVGFDTGSPYFMVMAESHAKSYLKTGAFEKLSSGFGISSRSLLGLRKADSLYRVKLPSVNIAGTRFNNVITETNKSSKTRIGNKLLDYGTVTIDFINQLFYFEPKTGNTDLEEKLWPLKPIFTENKLTVGVVWEKLKGQVNPGDQIIKIDDQPCETMDLCDWFNGKLDAMKNKQTVTLVIKDTEDKIKKIIIGKD